MAYGGRAALCSLNISAMSSDLTDFPWVFTQDNLPAAMFDADGSLPALNGGGDIVFTSDEAGTTRLSVDLRRFITDNDPVNGVAEIWVKIPSISSVTGATVYVHWGKAGETQPARDAAYGAEDVWSDNFRGVWHLDEDPTGPTGTMKDMTPNDNHGTGFGFIGNEVVDGQFGKACSFSDDSWITIPDDSTLEPSAGTLDIVIGDRTAHQYEKIAWKGSEADPDYGSYGLQGSDSYRDTKLDFQVSRTSTYGKVTTTSDITSGWHHVAGTYDNSVASSISAEVFVDGISEASNNWSGGDIQWDDVGLNLNADSSGGTGYQGTFKLEIVRVSNVVRSQQWIEASYRTMFAPATYTTVGTPSYDVYPSGIASEEAFGTPDIFVGLHPTGIASEEAFGAPALSTGNVDIAPSSILSEQAVGTPTVSVGSATLSPTGIATAESFGLPTITVGGIALQPSAIGSEESFGAPTILTGNVNVAPLGIASGESVGSPTSTSVVNVSPTGISSEEAFGSPTITTSISVAPTGIATAESFGAPSISTGNVNIAPDGIVSQEAVGEPSVVGGLVRITPTGIASEESVGSPTIQVGNVNLRPTGIPTAEAFGSPSFSVGATGISTTGIPSAESFGTPTIVPGGVFIGPSSITSSESFGVPHLYVEQFLSPSGIPSEESFGLATVSREGPRVFPVGIPSAEAFGIARFTITFALPSIPSEEAFETPTVTVIARNSFQQMMETDLDEGFFNCEEFAEPITIFYKDGSSLPTCGIFDEEYTTVDPETTVEMQSRNPMVMIQTSDLTRQNFEIDYIVIRGVQYNAIVPEPDGTGVTDIMLHHR